MTANTFDHNTAIDQLKQARIQLLRLHKALLDAEKNTMTKMIHVSRKRLG